MRKELKDLNGIHKIHFVGIGGAGMSPLAKILTEMGHEGSGSDAKRSDLTIQLEKLGAKIYDGHDAQNVRGKDAIVVSTAIPFDNPEVLAARDLGIPKLHRSDINAALVNEFRGIAVAGAHGKTTTTSMIGVAFHRAGVSPTVIVGGEMPDLGTNAILGKSEILVSEADESDGSFLKLRPHIAIVTNIENDHMDHYGTMENIRRAFTQFINQTAEDGAAILCLDSENIRQILPEIKSRVLTYAIDAEDADYRAVNIEMHEGGGSSFDILHHGEKMIHMEIHIPGRHNVLDALAAFVAAMASGVDPDAMAKGLSEFHGAKRRFQTKGRVRGIWIVDDYAHHPTEIMATLAAAKQTKPNRLICVFQPHRYSRTSLLMKDFASSFGDADLLVLTDIYAAGEQPIPGVTGESLFAEVLATGAKAKYIAGREDISGFLREFARDGDLIITMGAGDIYKTGEELAELL